MGLSRCGVAVGAQQGCGQGALEHGAAGGPALNVLAWSPGGRCAELRRLQGRAAPGGGEGVAVRRGCSGPSSSDVAELGGRQKRPGGARPARGTESRNRRQPTAVMLVLTFMLMAADVLTQPSNTPPPITLKKKRHPPGTLQVLLNAAPHPPQLCRQKGNDTSRHSTS